MFQKARMEKQMEDMKGKEKKKLLNIISKAKERLERREVTLDTRLEKKYRKVLLDTSTTSKEDPNLPLPEGMLSPKTFRQLTNIIWKRQDIQTSCMQRN